jgi:hypothetical protein
MPIPRRRIAVLILAPLPAVLGLTLSCAFGRTEPEAVPTRDSTIAVTTPVKAHLADGSIVVFPRGARVNREAIVGPGTRFDPTLRDSAHVEQVATDSVVGLESFSFQVDALPTIAANTLGLAALAAAASAAAMAIFGSCPTFYSDSAGREFLEAEAFSYSIAPRLEGRDVDRLRARPGPDGRVRLEVRNEAAETHYFNHLALLEVHHEAGEFVVPDAKGRPLAIAALTTPDRVTDGAGRDVRARIARADGRVFQSSGRLLADVRPDRVTDELVLSLPTDGADSVAIVLRMRNSLLTTVLLYDGMLRDQGARAVDWLGADLARLQDVIELGVWYQREMGIHVEVEEDGTWREVGRIGDSGPIAWEHVALMVPVPRGTDARIRLRFPIDNMRLDQLQVGTRARRPDTRTLPLDDARARDGRPVPEAASRLQEADQRYLSAAPGTAFTATFAPASPPAPGEARTYLLVAQGYDTEWLRPEWFLSPPRRLGFQPERARLVEALERWRRDGDDLERRFHATRIPVR